MGLHPAQYACPILTATHYGSVKGRVRGNKETQHAMEGKTYRTKIGDSVESNVISRVKSSGLPVIP